MSVKHNLHCQDYSHQYTTCVHDASRLFPRVQRIITNASLLDVGMPRIVFIYPSTEEQWVDAIRVQHSF